MYFAFSCCFALLRILIFKYLLQFNQIQIQRRRIGIKPKCPLKTFAEKHLLHKKLYLLHRRYDKSFHNVQTILL